jgi:dTDP-4-amino-4,6-dideoxygalactose transaminase
MRVNFSYLEQQFADIDPYLADLRDFLRTSEFTLGKPLVEFENRFATLCGMPHAIGVASGTDALILSLKICGIVSGAEVITTPTTFFATVGAIVASGAKPVFVDSEDGFVIDPAKIESAITPQTKAILVVHYTGNVADMPTIMEVARRHNLMVFEDACQSIAASIDGIPVGSWGETASFSLHPLKNLNVWGDGGVIVTRSAELAQQLRLYRNHGMINRDEIAVFGCNSRLDTLQAVIGNRLIKDVEWITSRRIANAQHYDECLASLGEFVQVPKRRHGVKHVYHLYMIRVKQRDSLLAHLHQNGIEAKIHYPVPLHLQSAARYLGYKEGDFPQCESDCRSIITLPVHQHLTQGQIDYTVKQIKAFYTTLGRR